MTISWYGEACFLLEAGGIRVLIEPPQKESGLTPPRLKSDILIMNGIREPEAGGWQSEAFTIDGPGEYEVKGVNVLGIANSSTDSEQANTLYSIEMDGVKIVHLGFLGENLSSDKLEILDDPDIVLAPIGGGSTLDSEKAMKLINNLEPSIVIPMLYDIKGLKIKRESLLPFLKESGAKDSPQPKLTVKKKDLAEEETKIVILSPYGGSPAGREKI